MYKLYFGVAWVLIHITPKPYTISEHDRILLFGFIAPTCEHNTIIIRNNMPLPFIAERLQNVKFLFRVFMRRINRV